MPRQRTSPTPPKEEVEVLDQTVYPLPQESQPDPVVGWEGREPFTFDKE
jgi:hypothetical protein